MIGKDVTSKKIVPFKWKFGESQVSLRVDRYAYGNRLYIGLISHSEEGTQPFTHMTINIPQYPLKPNEAFISGDISEDLLNFIKEYKLGVMLPDKARSGYREYASVAFDLDKLKEYDPDGVDKYVKSLNKKGKKR